MLQRQVPVILLLCAGYAGAPAYAQQPQGDSPVEDAELGDDEVPEGIPLREAYLDRLESTQTHFSFRRAPLPDILTALELATGVPVRLGDGAAKLLTKRKFKIRYVGDRTGLQVLEDLAKAAALDFEVTDDGALVDEAKPLAALRRELGLDPRRVKLTADDVARLLEDKRLSLVARERSLPAVLAFLRRETGIRFVRLGVDPEVAPPKLTAQLDDQPLGEVLTALLEPHDLAWLQRGTVIVVGSQATIDAQR